MKEKAKQSSTSQKSRLVPFSIIAVILILLVIFSNSKRVDTVQIINGPTSPPSVSGPSGPPPA